MNINWINYYNYRMVWYDMQTFQTKYNYLIHGTILKLKKKKKMNAKDNFPMLSVIKVSTVGC